MECCFCGLDIERNALGRCSFHREEPHIWDVPWSPDKQIRWPCCGVIEGDWQSSSLHSTENIWEGSGCIVRNKCLGSAAIAVVGDRLAEPFFLDASQKLAMINFDTHHIRAANAFAQDWKLYSLVYIVPEDTNREVLNRLCEQLLSDPQSPPFSIPDVVVDAGNFERQVSKCDYAGCSTKKDVRIVLRQSLFRDVHHTSSTAPTYFLSYSRRSPFSIHDLERHLSDSGACWIDVRELRPGILWSRDISQAIQCCDMFIASIDQTLADSSYVWREVDEAIAADRKIFAIVNATNTSPASAFARIIAAMNVTASDRWYLLENGLLWLDDPLDPRRGVLWTSRGADLQFNYSRIFPNLSEFLKDWPASVEYYIHTPATVTAALLSKLRDAATEVSEWHLERNIDSIETDGGKGTACKVSARISGILRRRHFVREHSIEDSEASPVVEVYNVSNSARISLLGRVGAVTARKRADIIILRSAAGIMPACIAKKMGVGVVASWYSIGGGLLWVSEEAGAERAIYVNSFEGASYAWVNRTLGPLMRNWPKSAKHYRQNAVQAPEFKYTPFQRLSQSIVAEMRAFGRSLAIVLPILLLIFGLIVAFL